MSGRSRSSKQRTNNLVALGSAAVLAVYSAGFVRTRAAAARFADEGPVRRPSDLSVVKSLHAASPSSGSESGASERDGGAPVGVVDNTTAAPIPLAATPRSVSGAGSAAVTTANSAAAKSRKDTTSVATAKATASDVPLASKVTQSSATSNAASPPTVVATPAPAAPAPAAPAAPAPTAPRPDSVVQRAATVAEAAPPAKEKVGYTDGVFYGWGTSRHGDIQAEVEIKNGRIVSASIAQCLTRYSCSWIAALPAQVVARQSADVDYVSGATQSTNAYYYAVVDALLKAK